MKIDRLTLVLALVATAVAWDRPLAAADAASRVTLAAVPGGGKPAVARIDKRGVIHLLADSDGGPRYARSTDGGKTLSAFIPVLGATARAPGLEFTAWAMAIGKSGRVHVAMGTNAWKLKLPPEEWGYFYASLEPGAETFSPVRNLNRKPSEGFSLAADDRGNVTACWLADRLYANVSRDGGTTFEPTIELDSSYNPCNCCTTSCCYGEDGRLAVLYREETANERDMYVVLWDQEKGRMKRIRVGRTSWKIDACPMTYFAVTPRPGGYAAVWPTRGQIDFAHINIDGSSPKLPEIPTPGRSGMRTGILALPSPDGGTLIAWKLDGELGWQLYDPSGHPSGTPGSARSPGNGAAGVVSKEGRFILFQ